MAMFRILITDDLSPQAVERLEAADDVKFEVVRRPAPEDLGEIIALYDAIIIRSSVQVDADRDGAGVARDERAQNEPSVQDPVGQGA